MGERKIRKVRGKKNRMEDIRNIRSEIIKAIRAENAHPYSARHQTLSARRGTDTHQGDAARDLEETSATWNSTVDVETHLQRLSLQLAGMAKATEERDAGLLDLGGPSLLVPPLRFVTERSMNRAFAAGTMLQIALYAPLLSLFVEPLALLVNE